MAEGHYKNASEELQNERTVYVECGPCKEDGTTIGAEGFCVDCNDYLCKPCYKGHKIPRPIKHHVLKDKYSMPTVKPTRKGVPCLIHSKEFVTQHCKTHDEVVCTLCMLQEHVNCDIVDITVSLFQNIRSSPEFKACLQSVSECADECRQDLKGLDRAVTGIDQTYVFTRQNVEQILDTMKDNDIRWNKALRCMSESLLDNIGAVQKGLDSTQSDDDEYYFIKMKMAKKIVFKSREHSNLLKVGNNITKFGAFDKTTIVARNGSTPILWTANNEYYLIPVDSIQRENSKGNLKGIAGYGRHIFALVHYNRSEFDKNTESIVTVDSITGHVVKITRAPRSLGICSISYINDSLFCLSTNYANVHVYRKYKSVRDTVQPDKYVVDVKGYGGLVGKTVIGNILGPGINTVRFHVIGEKAANAISVDTALGKVIYHDPDSGTMLSFRAQYLMLFEVASLKIIREEDMRTNMSQDPAVVKYGAKFYILCQGRGVFECNAKDLSDFCQVVKINDMNIATHQSTCLAVNDRHICLSPTTDGHIAVFRKP